jgi:hypothetical protein
MKSTLEKLKTVTDYKSRHFIDIKKVCPHCGAMNDDKVLTWIDECGLLCVMVTGETKCWYCRVWFHWELKKETTDKIFENEKNRR